MVFSASAVAIDPGQTTTRLLWLRGAPGRFEVAKALRFELGGEAGLTKALETIRAEKIPATGLVLGVPGSAATLRYNLIPPVPEWRLELIMKYEAEEMAEKSGEALSYDFVRLDVPESEGEDLILLVGMGRESAILPQIEILEAGHGRVRAAHPNALGIYHAYRQATREPRREGVLLADIGGRETHIALVQDGRLIFARTVNFGGNQIDEIIASNLSIKSESARKLKEGLKSGSTPEQLVETAQSTLRSAFGQLVSVLQSSITFCRAQTKIPELEIERVLVSGGSAQIPGLAAYVEEGLRAPVEILEPSAGGAELPGYSGEWATAFGLAASQLAPHPVAIDLLPAPAKARREFRERTVFLYAAAVVLVLAVLIQGGNGLVSYMQAQAEADQVNDFQSQVDSRLQELARARAENEKYRSQSDRVKRELKVTEFTASLLDALRDRRVFPAPLSLEDVRLTRVEEEGKLGMMVTISGRADNSDRKAIEHIEDLRRTFEAYPGVRKVDPEVGIKLSEGFVSFSIRLSPDDEFPEVGSGSRRNNRTGRQPRRGN